MYSNITNTLTIISILTVQLFNTASAILLNSKEQILSVKEISLNKRYGVKSVNDVFRDNILLNIAYLKGTAVDPKNIKWEEIQKPFEYEFKLNPGETFAFHDDILSSYQEAIVKTTNAHFNAQEGFKTDGYLYGDGVCHLASLIYWAAREAGLESTAPTPHDFMAIPEIPAEYGVSIYSNPENKGANAVQNLYIKNNKAKVVAFKFKYQDQNLKLKISELN